MKKIIASILCALLTITTAFASGIDWSSMTDQQIIMALAEGEAELDNRESSGSAQDNPVDTKQYEISNMQFSVPFYYRYSEYGNDYIVMQFDWTNTSDKPISFINGRLKITAYKDGIGLNMGVLFVNTDITTNVMPGYSLSSYYPFALNSKGDITIFVETYDEHFQTTELFSKTIAYSELKERKK